MNERITNNFFQNKKIQTKPELLVTPEQEKNIHEIELLTINIYNKISMVLLVLNIKKIIDISTLGLYAKNKEEAEKIAVAAEQKLQNIVDFCHKTGLEINSKKYVNENNGRFIGGYEISISKDKKTIEELDNATKTKDHKAMGILFGYPESAVSWFVNRHNNGNEIIDNSIELKNEIKKENLNEFLFFKPSPEHWKEELEVVKKNKEIIKKYAPRLYEEIITARKNNEGKTNCK